MGAPKVTAARSRYGDDRALRQDAVRLLDAHGNQLEPRVRAAEVVQAASELAERYA
jgi:hypothetical protein